MKRLRALLRRIRSNNEQFVIRDQDGMAIGVGYGLATQGLMLNVVLGGQAVDVVHVESGVAYSFEEPFPADAGDQVFFTLDLEV